MSEKNLLPTQLIEELEKRGKKAKIVPIRFLSASIKEIMRKCQSGSLDRQLFKCYFKDIAGKPSETKIPMKSLIITAAPQPLVRVGFAMNGRSLPFFIPPIYQSRTDQEVKQIIRGTIEPYGHTLADAPGALKLLAVTSGLARYGRNNITYIEGLGSFFRLKAFTSDLMPEEQHWEPYQLAGHCFNCSACQKACPTGAIQKERFLIHANRCLAYFNENPPEFPGWLNPEWHNCIVGCMRCQTVCPLNQDVVGWIEDREQFSDAETRMLLKKPSGGYPIPLWKKLERLDITEYVPVLSRNLGALIKMI